MEIRTHQEWLDNYQQECEEYVSESFFRKTPNRGIPLMLDLSNNKRGKYLAYFTNMKKYGLVNKKDLKDLEVKGFLNKLISITAHGKNIKDIFDDIDGMISHQLPFEVDDDRIKTEKDLNKRVLEICKPFRQDWNRLYRIFDSGTIDNKKVQQVMDAYGINDLPLVVKRIISYNGNRTFTLFKTHYKIMYSDVKYEILDLQTILSLK